MNGRIAAVTRLAATFIGLTLLAANAQAQLAVSSNDNKMVRVNGVVSVPQNPPEDTVTIIDLGVSPPKVIGEIKAPSSVAGPPQNVAITPDESLALVAASMQVDAADPHKTVPANRSSVIDLKDNAPVL